MLIIHILDHFAARLDALVLNSTRTNDLLSSHIARFDKYIDDRQRSDLQDRWERYEFDKKRYIYEKQVRDQAARQEAKVSNIFQYFQAEC